MLGSLAWDNNYKLQINVQKKRVNVVLFRMVLIVLKSQQKHTGISHKLNLRKKKHKHCDPLLYSLFCEENVFIFLFPISLGPEWTNSSSLVR